ncbi:MAG: beta-N-acetylhexosaminidase [Clostridia bacterium]|nr:beta-N-acetylhexosaminidase [Clostridia bacterium]MDE7328467.1 beta-N-acetylhexosaminidase [Clostridia bacterium]
MNLIPLPNALAPKEGSLVLGGKTVVEGEFPQAKEFIARLLQDFTEGENTRIELVKDETLSKEGYEIDCNSNTVLIKAATEVGAFYAFVTVKQSLGGKNILNRVYVKDEPKYGYRGFMLDCARHFWSVEKIKSFLDVLADLKMNVFHWHLTDDQGWRAEIKKYPLLTQKATARRRTALSPKANEGAGDWGFDENEYGRGLFYTQNDMKDVVAYAKERHIEVVPEIDMPGHMVAAISCYPKLSCLEEEVEVRAKWGVSENICCCGKEDVYNFARDVIDELSEIFTGKFFHIGGDEVPKSRWKNCPRCQAKIKELGLKDENALQGYFNNEIAKYLRSKGKRMIGWNEILDARDIMQTDVVAQWWLKHGQAKRNAFDWLAKGGSCILSRENYVYMDHPYNVRPLKKTYSFSAKTLGVNDEKNILGMEIPQWTEYIRNEAKLDMLTCARLVAFAEACWKDRGERNYKDFENRLENMREYFASIGCNICPQKIYRGKAYPLSALTYALKWKLWRDNPDYEYLQIKKKSNK